MPSETRKADYQRTYCYNCGTPWSFSEIICPQCGSTDKSQLISRPLQRTENEFQCFDGPWSEIPWPTQGTVAVYGGPGTGKSSLSSLIQPTHWLTKEQEPQPASMMFRRTTPSWMPKIAAVDSPEEVREVLSTIESGPVVVDSLTAFGLKESLEIAHIMVSWSRDNNDRCLAILQANQGGGAAGYLEIPHLFDCVVRVEHDPWGVRVFRIEKSRWCSLENIYFSFSDTGAVIEPDFPAAYSVEGNSGAYYLHPFPVKGAKWDGLVRSLNELSELEPRTASSAQIAPYMPSGFVSPMDGRERRRFAERAGLTWIDPDSLSEILQHRIEE